MHVVEYQPNRVVADRLDFEDHDITLAGDGLALVRGMPLHLGARAVDAQEFGRKFEHLAGVERNREGRLVLAEPQLSWPRCAGFRCGVRPAVVRSIRRCETQWSAPGCAGGAPCLSSLGWWAG